MSDTDKNYMLGRLLQESSFAQLYFLQENLHKINHQDFMVLLPKEIIEYILSFLDLKALCICCQVSQNWNAFIQACQSIWKSQCQSLGLCINQSVKHVIENGNETYRQVCLRMARQMHLMKTHRGFRYGTYSGSTTRITAVNYWKSKLATGTEDGELVIWDTEKDEILHKSKMTGDFCFTCISFNDELLLAGSSTGFLESLDMKRMRERRLFGQFSAAIFSIDFNFTLNLAVSGSADNLVKLWSLSQGHLMRTLHGHTHWIVKVLLRPWRYHSGQFNKADAVLLSMDKERILMWPIAKDASLHLRPVASIPLGNNPLSFFTPGLHFCDHYIYFMRQELGDSSCTKLCKYDLLTNEKESEITLNVLVKILLSVGTKYFCIITPQSHNPNLLVLDVDTLQEVALWTLPFSRYIYLIFKMCI